MRLERVAWSLRFAGASAALFCIVAGIVAHAIKQQSVADWFGNIAYFCLLAAVIAAFASR